MHTEQHSFLITPDCCNCRSRNLCNLGNLWINFLESKSKSFGGNAMTNRHTLSFALRAVSFAFLLLTSGFWLLTPAFGQSATATLSGTVVDQNNAIVQGAAITVTNTATGLKRE